MDSKINRKKRIITDLQRLRDPPEPHLPKYDIRQEKANDLNVIYTEIRGPKDSFYTGGYFVIRFEFTNDYPVSSPSVAFHTKIWHPNVDHKTGSVCLNSLNQNWQPTVNIRHILDTHMPWLLKNGNPDDPLNADAGQQMKSKDPKYQSVVKQWVKNFASKSHLHSAGSIWYKDKGNKKKKKKKKFSIAELTNTPNIVKIKSDLPPILPKTRIASKSVGNMDDFQDWWTQSKMLPNTPSKSISATPQIMRSHSFCNYNDEETINKHNHKHKQHKQKRKKKRKRHRNRKKDVMDDGSDLSSMDEDPVYDLGTYESLNTFDIGCITNYKWNGSGSQTPSYSHSTSHRHATSNNNHNNGVSDSVRGYRVSHMNDIYSKSDGFMPQNSFFCPEFSPLCPAKSNSFMNLHEINDKERILHFAPLTTTMNSNQRASDHVDDDDEDDDDDYDDYDDDDEDIVPIPSTKHIVKHKMAQKLMDIDMENKNILIANDQSKMAID